MRKEISNEFQFQGRLLAQLEADIEYLKELHEDDLTGFELSRISMIRASLQACINALEAF